MNYHLALKFVKNFGLLMYSCERSQSQDPPLVCICSHMGYPLPNAKVIYEWPLKKKIEHFQNIKKLIAYYLMV